MSLTSYPRTFGSIKVWAQKPKVAQDVEVPKELYEEDAKELWMTMDNVPFLLITRNTAGKINCLYLVKENCRPVFWMEPLPTPGKWGNARYSDVKLTDRPVGDVLRDFNFDGRFDSKFSLTADGNKPPGSLFIYIDGSWQKVDHFRYDVNETQASIAGTRYIFDPNSGWQQKQ